MKSVLAAWQFLTVFPLPKSLKIETKDLENSPTYFPLVGLVLGLIAASFDHAARWAFPASVASVLLAIFLIVLSGAFHLDGLADTADGFLSSRSREKILDIMRDSRSGPMAVIVVVGVFVLKCTLIFELQSLHRFTILILVPLLGRCNSLFVMNLLPYARTDGGLASVFVKRSSKASLIFSYAFVLFSSFYFMGFNGPFIVVGAVIFGLLFSRYCFKKIGGFTGDTLGAVCELTELWILLLAIAMKKMEVV